MSEVADSVGVYHYMFDLVQHTNIELVEIRMISRSYQDLL